MGGPRAPIFEPYFSTTKDQPVLCPLCGSKKFRVTSRRNGEFDIECRGKKVRVFNEEFRIFEWQDNNCPWNIRLSKADFVRAAIAKSQVEAENGLALRERAREKARRAREKKNVVGEMLQ